MAAAIMHLCFPLLVKNSVCSRVFIRGFHSVSIVVVLVLGSGCRQQMPVGVASHARECFPDARVAKLALAAEEGDLAEMKTLVQMGVDIDGRGMKGVTPAWWAIYNHELEIFLWLLDHGASANPEIETITILDLAASLADSRYLKAAVRHGADVNYIGGSSMSPLNTAVAFDRLDNFNFLLKAGADPNQVEGGLPLVFAAHLNAYDYVILLLKAGADPAKTLDGRRSALALAIGSGYIEPKSRSFLLRQEVIEILRQEGIDAKPPAGG